MNDHGQIDYNLNNNNQNIDVLYVVYNNVQFRFNNENNMVYKQPQQLQPLQVH